MSKRQSKVLTVFAHETDAADIVRAEHYAANAAAHLDRPSTDCSDIDALDAQGIAKAPSSFAAAAFALGCIIARELRLLRAGVKP